MNINSIKIFKYKDYSQNIFTKIQLVNALTQKEMSKLNEKYKELGLFIKQVEVDINGNEIHPNESLLGNNFLKKKRRLKKHTRMTLQEFYDKYYSNNKKSNEKNKIKKNNNNESSEEINENEYENDDLCNKDELINLTYNMEEIYKDCQNINFKKCKIDDIEFKKKIIEYIKKYSEYITDKQYTNLFLKWKYRNGLIKGVDIFDIDNLYDWKIPILKGFKSEIALLAIENVLKKQIGDNNNSEEEQNDEKDKKINKEKDEDVNKEDEDESKSDSQSNYSNNDYYKNIMTSQKYIVNDDEDE